jgi:hypothetical protein
VWCSPFGIADSYGGVGSRRVGRNGSFSQGKCLLGLCWSLRDVCRLATGYESSTLQSPVQFDLQSSAFCKEREKNKGEIDRDFSQSRHALVAVLSCTRTSPAVRSN